MACAMATSRGISSARSGEAACGRIFVGNGASSAPITIMPSTSAISATATEGRVTPARIRRMPSKVLMPVCVGV